MTMHFILTAQRVIIEWEGSRCRRLQGGEAWRGGIPIPTRGRVWGGRRGPSPENLSYFLLKIPYFDAFWRVYFLNHTPIEGVPTPLKPPNPLLGTPMCPDA